MCGLAWMWNDDNVDSARIHLETHGSSHDISLLGTSKNGGILASRARYYQKLLGKVNSKCWAKGTSVCYGLGGRSKKS